MSDSITTPIALPKNINFEKRPTGVLRPLLTPLKAPGEYLMVVDNSTLEVGTRCPTAYFYNCVLRREAFARNASLTFGGAIHKGFEALLRSAPKSEQDDAIVRYFADNPTPPDEYRTPVAALQILKHYRVRQEFPDYEWEILSHNGTPIIERAFELPLGTLDVNADISLPTWPSPQYVKIIHVAWSGRIDLVARTMGHNRVVDHKTTSIGGDRFSQPFFLSHQAIGYVWAAQHMFPELNIDSFCVNAVFFKKPTGSGSLTAAGPRGGPPPLDFFRVYYTYTPDRIKEWEVNSMTIIEDLVHCIVRNTYPMFTYNCFNKYGRCQYYDVCTLDSREVRRRMISSDAFTNVTWSPTTEE
jgi:hypothetical protein